MDPSNTCPHCKQAPCLALWRKLIMGPGASARCKVCGYKVGVEPLKALLLMLPLFLLALSITLGLLTDAVAAVVLLFGLLLIGGVLYASWLPLVPREITNPRLVALRVAETQEKARSSTR